MLHSFPLSVFVCSMCSMGPHGPLRDRAPAEEPLAPGPHGAVGPRGLTGPDPRTPRRRPGQPGNGVISDLRTIGASGTLDGDLSG
jgi:hypothetical protein